MASKESLFDTYIRWVSGLLGEPIETTATVAEPEHGSPAGEGEVHINFTLGVKYTDSITNFTGTATGLDMELHGTDMVKLETGGDDGEPKVFWFETSRLRLADEIVPVEVEDDAEHEPFSGWFDEAFDETPRAAFDEDDEFDDEGPICDLDCPLGVCVKMEVDQLPQPSSLDDAYLAGYQRGQRIDSDGVFWPAAKVEDALPPRAYAEFTMTQLIEMDDDLSPAERLNEALRLALYEYAEDLIDEKLAEMPGLGGMGLGSSFAPGGVVPKSGDHPVFGMIAPRGFRPDGTIAW